MKTLEFFANVSIGQYIDSGSFVHRLTPATKFFGIVVFFIVMFATTNVTGTVLLGLCVLAAALVAKVNPLFLLRGIKPALPFLIILSILTLIFQSGSSGPALLSLGPLSIHAATLLALLLLFARFAAVLAAIGLLTSVTAEQEIAHGIEDFLAPLGRIGFPAHEFSLMIAVALRFVPIVTGELESIVKAQASRGGDFGASGINPIRKARSYLPLFVPLVVRTLERAELLVEAMEARCYTGDERTRYTIYEMIKGEAFVRLGLTLFMVGGVAFGLLFAKTLP
jgi:energy-coupling factor transport system permease protein